MLEINNSGYAVVVIDVLEFCNIYGAQSYLDQYNVIRWKQCAWDMILKRHLEPSKETM